MLRGAKAARPLKSGLKGAAYSGARPRPGHARALARQDAGSHQESAMVTRPLHQHDIPQTPPAEMPVEPDKGPIEPLIPEDPDAEPVDPMP